MLIYRAKLLYVNLKSNFLKKHFKIYSLAAVGIFVENIGLFYLSSIAENSFQVLPDAIFIIYLQCLEHELLRLMKFYQKFLRISL